MNITLIVGLVLAGVVIVFGIGLASIGNFIDTPSIIIVMGGTLAGIIATTPLSELKNIPKHIIIALLKGNKYKPEDFIDEIVDCAKVARTSGLLALEERANQQEDPFFQESLLLIVDAIDADKIRERLTTELDNLDNRHAASVSIYDRGNALAPSMGMIGTLIGLINMLKSMNLDDAGGASALGESMSVALVTTFYGSALANLVFLPISEQLKAIHNSEMLCKEIIIEGVLAVQAGENPKFIKEKLLSFLSDREKERLSESSGD